MDAWDNFKGTKWKNNIDVDNFIESNYEEYLGNEEFLCGISLKTSKVWNKCQKLLEKEQISGVLDVETYRFSGIDNFEVGYIDRHNEVIVGLQTDEPLKRIVNPYGGIRMAKEALEAYGYHLSSELEEKFKEYRKTHNEGVFDSYTDDIKLARHNHLITGLPDAYGRGRIIGDYRRLALYGTDRLISEKEKDLDKLKDVANTSIIQLREDVKEQIKALNEIKKMASRYGFDVSRPAENAKEAFQWLYFAYLAAVKQNNGAATSIGRNSTFLDIYIERDIKNGKLTESEAQELIDQYVIKLRLVRHLRTPSYNELFAGDPTWVTESIGGMKDDEASYVTKTSYRMLHSLNNIGSSAEPNLTVLWSRNLPENFKKFATLMSIKTHTLQFENDDLMRPMYGNDYAIACCVSAMKLGYQTQFFGARMNLVKVLLYALNGGRDEITGDLVIEGIPQIEGEYLNVEEVYKNFELVLKKTVKIYVDALNTIHYMHDKYAYESAQMAFLNTELEYLMAFGLAGISIIGDSFSAMQYGHVRVKRNEKGITEAFDVELEYPRYGNNDDRVDAIVVSIVKRVFREIKKYPLYKGAKPTLSLLTITSNVMYGKNTGASPDGRKKGVPFAPGANPTSGTDKEGALASLQSVAKIPYKDCCEDGISNTFTISPKALGESLELEVSNLIKILDGYMKSGGHHINVNVLDKEMLIDAMNNPTKYPNLTIRVSGYAVNFNKLTKEQQTEVISRTFHEKM